MVQTYCSFFFLILGYFNSNLSISYKNRTFQIKIQTQHQFTWRYDIHHNDTQHNDTQHNDTQHYGLNLTLRLNDIQRNDTLHKN